MDISKLGTKELQNWLARIPDELNKRELQAKKHYLIKLLKLLRSGDIPSRN